MIPKIKDKVFEIATLSIVAIGITAGLAEPSEGGNLYYGENHGGDISHPPDGSVISTELSESSGYPVAVNPSGEIYTYVTSHWFDPQQMAEFPSEVWMYGVAPYDHHPSGSSGAE